jgi:hypothetical protein
MLRYLVMMLAKAGHFLKIIKVAIATGFHLFPFRTEKLSLSAPMVLRKVGE